MKPNILLVLGLSLFTSVAAQTKCFLPLYLEGKAACENRQFNTALKILLPARTCPDKPADSGLEDWIRKAEQGRAERDIWHKALQADSPEGYQLYLDFYPKGYYRQKADGHLKRIEKLAQKPVLQPSPKGSVNWTQAYIEATGKCIVNLEKWPNEAQALLMAQHCAETVAKANLLETMEGVQITRSSTIKDMAAESDLIQGIVTGTVKGARMIGEPVAEKGMMSVTMRLPLFGSDGLATALQQGNPPGMDTLDLDDSLATRLVLRVPNLPRKPILFPSIVDADNNLLLDGASFQKQYATPMLRYAHAAGNLTDTAFLDVQWDAEGRLVMSHSATPLFRQWLKDRASGAAVQPILVLGP